LEKKEILQYIYSFAADYAENGHDGSKREQEADKGTDKYRKFRDFVNDNYGKNALIDLFKSNKNDNSQINTLYRWWTEYQQSQKK